jgi:ActR/RegA family two-component response regulator
MAEPTGRPELKPTPADPHLLLVAQDGLDAQALAAGLRRRGWRVTHTERAAAALPLWDSSGAQVALIQLDQDRVSALALMAAGRRLKPHRRAVALTRELGAARLPSAIKESLGLSGVVVRPCHVDAVNAAVVRAFDTVSRWVVARSLTADG